jgi:O-antigen ligase
LVVVLLFLLWTPWLRLPSIPQPLTSYYFSFVWLTTILAGVFAYAVWKKWFQLPKSPVTGFVLAWVGVKIVSSFFSLVPLHSIWGGYGIWADGILYALVLLVFLSLLASLKLKESEATVLLHALIWQNVLVGLIVLVTRFEGTMRPASVFLNSDYFLSYTLLIFPLACVVCWRAVRSRVSRLRIVLSLISVVILLASLFVSLPGELQQKLLFQDPSDAATFLETRANAERFYQWRLGIEITKQHPWLGSGPGSTQAAFYDLHKTFAVQNWDYTVYMAHPHNDLIEQASQTGIIGLIAYLAMLIAIGVVIWRSRANIPDPLRLYALGLALGLTAFFLFNQFLFLLPYTGVLAGIWIVLLLQWSGQLTFVTQPRFIKVSQVGTLLVFILLMVASYWTIRYARAEQLVVQGIRASHAGNTADAAVLTARATSLYPYEELYAWRASNEGLAFVTSGSAKITPQLLTTLQGFSDRAMTRNPYVPLYTLQHGMLLYLFDSPGSPQEAQGLALIDQAIAVTPHDYTLYTRAARVFQQKNDLARRDAYIAKARASTKDARVEDEIRQILGH